MEPATATGIDDAGGAENTAADYPAAWEADVVVRDGHTVKVRPIVPDDADRLVRFHSRQSPESIYFRYFSPRPTLSEKDLHHFTHVDHHDRVAFVALAGDEVIAVARYERYRGTDTAEVAFFVDDAHHGRGLAGLLLEYLAAAGRERGVRRFAASTLPNNRSMLAVFRNAGYEVTSRVEDGVVELGFAIDPTDESVAVLERRERAAESASIQPLLVPASIAVIGVGRDGGVGAQVYASLRDSGFTGTLHAVNSRSQRPEVLNDVRDLPEGIDLVVVATPSDQVVQIVQHCGELGARAALVLSAGFAESGEDGLARQRQLREVIRSYGMRLLGPNSSGVLNTDPAVAMNATIAPHMPREGTVGVLADAGTLSVALIEHAARTELGVSSVVAPGNRADVSATDLLSYWVDDERTEGVLLYVGDQLLRPRFVRAARATSLRKPIAALHTSGSASGAGGAGAERRARAMFRQTGIISVDTLQELFDIGRVVADQPVPGGPGVGIIGNSGAAIALAADACRRAGLDLDTTPPVDLAHGATARDLARELDALAAPGTGTDNSLHAVLVVWAPPLFDRDPSIEAVVLEFSRAHPELTVVITLLDALDRTRLHDPDVSSTAVPAFRFPEEAARAVGRLAEYRSWRSAAAAGGASDDHEIRTADAEAVVAGALDRRDGAEAEVELSHGEQDVLLAAAGVQVIPRTVVEHRGDLERVGAALGWPVVFKANARDRGARSVASGVVLDLHDADAAEQTWERMEDLLGESMHPVVVQRFVDGGVDAMVRIRRRPDGSATVEVGLGGPASVGGQTEMGVLPLTLADAATLVSASPIARVLSDPLDRVPIVELVQRLGALATEVAEVHLLQVDPVVCSPAAALVADARVVLGDAPDELDVRRLD